MSAKLELTPADVQAIQRTSKAARFVNWRDNLKNLLDGLTPEDQKKAAAANQNFLRGLANPRSSADPDAQRAVTPAAVHVDTLLATMSVMYANGDYIGEQLMPVVPVAKRSDKYSVYPKRERLAFPDDEIGTRAREVLREGRDSLETDDLAEETESLHHRVDGGRVVPLGEDVAGTRRFVERGVGVGLLVVRETDTHAGLGLPPPIKTAAAMSGRSAHQTLVVYQNTIRRLDMQ